MLIRGIPKTRSLFGENQKLKNSLLQNQREETESLKGLLVVKARVKAALAKSELTHLFVLQKNSTNNQQVSLRKLAESCSDSVITLNQGVVYASLQGTKGYFEAQSGKNSLESELLTALQQSEYYQPENHIAVFSNHFLRGLVYLLEQEKQSHFREITNVHFLSSSNINYIQFQNQLNWETWCEHTKNIVPLLCWKKSAQENTIQTLPLFVKTMQHLRFQNPAKVPAELENPGFEKRFGSYLLQLWKNWSGVSAHFPTELLLQTENAIDASLFATNLQNLESFDNCPVVGVGRFGEAFEELLWKLLERMGTELALKSFFLDIKFNDNWQWHTTIHVHNPMNGCNDCRNPNLIRFVKSLRENLENTTLEKVVLKENAQIFDENFDKNFDENFDKNFELEPLLDTIEHFEIVPCELFCTSPEATSLFEDAFLAKKSQILEALHLQGFLQACFLHNPSSNLPGTPCQKILLSEMLAAETSNSQFSKSKPNTRLSQNILPQKTHGIYHASFLNRPCGNVSAPLAAEFSHAELSQFEFCECDDTFDYYIFSPIQNKVSLWLRAPISARLLHENKRKWEVLGYL